MRGWSIIKNDTADLGADKGRRRTRHVDENVVGRRPLVMQTPHCCCTPCSKRFDEHDQSPEVYGVARLRSITGINRMKYMVTD